MNFKDHVLPHLIAVLIFLGATVIFYSPVVFSGKSIDQHDILQGLGASQEIIEYRDQTGEEALWTNSMFGGMPSYLINTQWSGDLMLYVHRLFSLWLPSTAAVTLVSCICFYILLLAFGVRPWLAVAGGLAYGFGTFNIISIEVGHMWKVWAIAYMPLVLAGVHLTFKRKYLMGSVLTAVALALELRSNHLQITYYLLLLLLIYGAVTLIHAVRKGTVTTLLKPLGYLVLAALLALACNFGKIWSVYEYGKYSTRGPSELTQDPEESSSGLDRDYAFRWSNGIIEPVTLLIPEFFGGPSVSSLPSDSHLGDALRNNGLAPVQVRQQLEQVRTYWGKQPITAGPSYAGAIVILLFIIGVLAIKTPERWWLIVATVLSIMWSWGHNFEFFNNFMFDYFPGYNKFRSVSMTLVIALLCIPLLGFLGLEKLLSQKDRVGALKILLRAGLILGGMLVVAIIFAGIGDFRGSVDDLMAGQVPQWYLEALRSDRAALLRNDAIRALVFSGLAWAGLNYYLKSKITPVVLYTALAALILIDLWTVNKRYLQDEDYVSERNLGYAATAADEEILKDPDPNFRVLSYLQNPWNEARTSYFHKSIGGYHGAKMHRYADVIEGCLDQQYQSLLSDLQNGRMNVSAYSMLNMLNTRYIIAGTEAGHVLRNDGALGHAWFVPRVKKVQSPDEEFSNLCSFDPAAEALVDVSKFPLEADRYSAEGQIQLEEYRPNFLKYVSSNQGDGLAVFSEIYYPKGWRATIDGQDAEIIRANYLLRALLIPTGTHTIEFRFLPMAYAVGNKVMLISTALLILLLVVTVTVELRKTKNHLES